MQRFVIVTKVMNLSQPSVIFQKGRDSLNGRFFGGRTVQAQIYDQMLYEEEDFSH